MTFRRGKATALLLVGVLAGGGCISPSPTMTTESSATDSSAVASASDDPITPGLSGVHWFEAASAGNLRGSASRELLYGTLDGSWDGTVPISQIDAADEGLKRNVYRWSDPQVAGLFGHEALVWGRGGEADLLEAVDLSDGSIRELARAQGMIHVATATSDLASVFYVTANGETGEVTGLWSLDPEAGSNIRLDYEFTSGIGDFFQYQLMVSSDAETLAIQGSAFETTILGLGNGSVSVSNPGGPLVGFADDVLVTLGPPDSLDQRPVLAISRNGSAEPLIIDPAANSARVIDGAGGDYVATMHIDPENANRYEIVATHLRRGDAHVAYSYDGDEPGPLLARVDRTFLGTSALPDWVLLVDSFQPFLEGESRPSRNPPASSYPVLVHLPTGATVRCGPFVER